MNKQNLELEHGLLLKVKENKAEFDKLYKYFINDVYRFSYSLINNKYDAEDITSQTFIEFYNKIEGFEWQNISIKYWLFRTARNLAFKKMNSHQYTELDENIHIDQEYEISFVDQIMNKDLLSKVQEEIQKLNPLEQELINLRIWEGMQFSEIAGIQNTSEDTTKKRFYRSIEKLKKSLEKRNIKALVALPLLFTAIAQVGISPAYAAPLTISSATISTLLINQQTMPGILTTIKTFLATKAGIGLTSAVIITTALGGGIYFTNQKQDDVITDNQPTAVTTPTNEPTTLITNTSTPSITLTSTPSITLTSTPSPLDPYAGWKLYESRDLGISFKYPESIGSIEAFPKTTTNGVTTNASISINSKLSDSKTVNPLISFIDTRGKVRDTLIDQDVRQDLRISFTEYNLVNSGKYKIFQYSFGDISSDRRCTKQNVIIGASNVDYLDINLYKRQFESCKENGVNIDLKTKNEDLMIAKQIVESIKFSNITPTTKEFKDAELGISFMYPSNFTVEVKKETYSKTVRVKKDEKNSISFFQHIDGPVGGETSTITPSTPKFLLSNGLYAYRRNYNNESLLFIYTAGEEAGEQFEYGGPVFFPIYTTPKYMTVVRVDNINNIAEFDNIVKTVKKI